MGVGIVPLFDQEVPGAFYDGDGKGLAAEIDKLDALATAMGVTPLSEFVNSDPSQPLDFFEEDEEIPADLQALIDSGTGTTFFDVKRGLQTVRALTAAIRASHPQAKPLRERDYTLEELTELERCLKLAAEKQAKFCMQYW